MNKEQDGEDKNRTDNTSVRPVLWRGVRGLCPQCGLGKIFEGYLKQVDKCQNCQEDIGSLRADDGPAFVTILVTGIIIAPFFTLFALNETMPQWVLMGSLFVLIIGLVFTMLRSTKGLFIATLWFTRNKQ